MFFCASGATVPRAVKTLPDAVNYLRQVLNPRKDEGLTSLPQVTFSDRPGRAGIRPGSS